MITDPRSINADSLDFHPVSTTAQLASSRRGKAIADHGEVHGAAAAVPQPRPHHDRRRKELPHRPQIPSVLFCPYISLRTHDFRSAQVHA